MTKQRTNVNAEALRKGNWVKLICGASNQDLPSIADLCAIYATAGVHCIDLSADVAVVSAARQALDWVENRTGLRPWLMVSLSDGKDAHFRKAWFDPLKCPANCKRPCQKICPAAAISNQGGIDSQKCYGCARCIPICPKGIIHEQDRHISIEDFALLLTNLQPDAVEIHTAPGRLREFKKTINQLMAANLNLKRLAVSCGLEGYGINAEELAQELWGRYQYLRQHGQKPLWQIDGKRMSGDIGASSAKIAVDLWQQVRPHAPPGPLQLAGGTNKATINHLPENDGPEGIAFGGMARKMIQPWLIEAQFKNTTLREWPEGWEAALEEAKKLIQPWLLRPSTINHS